MSASIVAINEANHVPLSLQVSSDLLRTPTTEHGAASVSAFVSLLADLHVRPTHNSIRSMFSCIFAVRNRRQTPSTA